MRKGEGGSRLAGEEVKRGESGRAKEGDGRGRGRKFRGVGNGEKGGEGLLTWRTRSVKPVLLRLRCARGGD